MVYFCAHAGQINIYMLNIISGHLGQIIICLWGIIYACLGCIWGGGGWPQYACFTAQGHVDALCGYCVRTACSAHAMNPKEKGRKPPCIYAGITRFFISLVVDGHGQAQRAIA